MANPVSFTDTLRIHDLAIYNWLGQIPFNYGPGLGDGRILRVMATPDRAFATVFDQLVKRKWFTGLTDAEARERAKNPDMAVLPLPLITINRGKPVIDMKMAGSPKLDKAKQYVNGKLVEHPWPVIYQCDYTLSLWSQKKYTEAWIEEWLMSQFGKIGASPNETFLHVDYPEPWGTQLQSLKFEDAIDLSRNEDNEDEPRYMRADYRLTLRMLHFRQAGEQKDLVERVQVSMGVEGDQTSFEGEPDYAGNLFDNFSPDLSLIPASVKLSSQDGVVSSVFSAASSVVLGSIPLKPAPPRIISLSFKYLCESNATLEASESANRDEWFSAFVHPLEAGRWRSVHKFFGLGREWLDLQISSPGANRVTLRDVALSAPVLGTPVAGTVGAPGQWSCTGLSPRPYLAVVAFTPASGDEGAITVRDDASDPSYTNAVTHNCADMAYFVALLQPKGGSVAVEVAAPLEAASLTMYPYDGGYDGND